MGIRGMRCQVHGCKKSAIHKEWVTRTIHYPLREVEPGVKVEVGPNGERGPAHVLREVSLCDQHLNDIKSMRPVNVNGKSYYLCDC